MRAGKDALLVGNYEEALKQFDVALIEEPTNKDAIALYERAYKSLAEEKEKKEQEEIEAEMRKTINEYTETRMPIYNKIILLSESTSKETLTVLDKRNIRNEIDSLKIELESIINTYTAEGKIIRLKDLRKKTFDDLLVSSLNRIESYFDKKVEGKLTGVFSNMDIGVAKENLKEWKKETDTYK
jgi:tetratricopeptide (TPR) repeat protein